MAATTIPHIEIHVEFFLGVYLQIIIPLHVSGIWIPYYSSSPVESGSMGIGLNLALYMKAAVNRGLCRVVLNEREVFGDLARKICMDAGVSAETRILSPVDLGLGFGVSAGVLIAASLGSYLLAGRSSLKALQKAHSLEVENRTGLGDVIAEYTGGLAVRIKPGAPGIGYAYRIIPKEQVNLLVTTLGPTESTPLMLSRMNNEILELGGKLLREIIETEDISMFFEYSKTFTRKLFNYSYVDDLLRNTRGVINYYLKKSALVIWVEKEFAGEVSEYLKTRKLKTYSTTISQIGVTVAYSTKSPQKN